MLKENDATPTRLKAMVDDASILRRPIPSLGPFDGREFQDGNGVRVEVAFKHLRNRPALDDNRPPYCATVSSTCSAYVRISR